MPYTPITIVRRKTIIKKWNIRVRYIIYIHTNATCIIILIKFVHMWIADLAKAAGENEKKT